MLVCYIAYCEIWSLFQNPETIAGERGMNKMSHHPGVSQTNVTGYEDGSYILTKTQYTHLTGSYHPAYNKLLVPYIQIFIIQKCLTLYEHVVTTVIK